MNFSFRFIAFTFFIALSANLSCAQGRCNPFKGLKFKNGVDTITIRCVFNEINPMAAPYVSQLKNEKNIREKDFTYQLVFKPIGCDNTFFGPSSAKSFYLNNPAHVGKLIAITCVVFEKYKYDNKGTPFFVVINVTPISK